MIELLPDERPSFLESVGSKPSAATSASPISAWFLGGSFFTLIQHSIVGATGANLWSLNGPYVLGKLHRCELACGPSLNDESHSSPWLESTPELDFRMRPEWPAL